jgi:polar amino acid transport system substrate-binding protein
MEVIMKKIVTLFLTIAMVMSSLTGCTSNSSKITELEDMKGKSLGTFVLNGYDEDSSLDMFSKIYNIELEQVVIYDSEASLIMALDKGKIDAAWLRDFQATIYTQESDKYSLLSSEDNNKIAGAARMVAAINTPAATDIDKINKALEQLKSDGTLDTLRKDYIDDFTFSKNYDSISMPVIEGAPTYKVSISGSMVPIDYIAADGNPTGYSIALLAMISKTANLNFELVTVGLSTERLELTSGKIDYIFCNTITEYSLARDTEAKFSDPYYTYDAAALLVKK